MKIISSLWAIISLMKLIHHGEPYHKYGRPLDKIKHLRTGTHLLVLLNWNRKELGVSEGYSIALASD